MRTMLALITPVCFTAFRLPEPRGVTRGWVAEYKTRAPRFWNLNLAFCLERIPKALRQATEGRTTTHVVGPVWGGREYRPRERGLRCLLGYAWHPSQVAERRP